MAGEIGSAIVTVKWNIIGRWDYQPEIVSYFSGCDIVLLKDIEVLFFKLSYL